MKIRNAATIIVVLVITFVISTSCTQGNIYAQEMKESRYERVIAHGGGSYKGYDTTNSVEALTQAIQNGYQLIELDMMLSSDQKIIMLHDWDRTTEHYLDAHFDKKITENQFLELSIHDELEVLTFDKLISILKKVPEVRIVSDTKGDNVRLLTLIAEEYPEAVSRIVPQIYDYDELAPVKALGYEEIIFTLYKQPTFDMEKLIAFVEENDLYAVTMPDYYAERGYCRKLSSCGIKVYVHPVTTMEQADQALSFGAYGVYSGTLLPEEFAGLEKNYYLIATAENGETVKLEDAFFLHLNELKLHGLKAGEKVTFYLDLNEEPVSLTDMKQIEKGKHILTLKINAITGEPLGELQYFLWSEGQRFRVLHKKLEYRLDLAKEPKDFAVVMEDFHIEPEIAELLAHSVIAKKGQDWFYRYGSPDRYQNKQEYFAPQQGNNGKLLLPLFDTAMALGAKSVKMDQGKDLAIQYGSDTYRITIESPYLRNGFRIARLKTPVSLYLSKAMAGGEVFQLITGRPYIERENMVIFLSKGTKLTKEKEDLLLQAAKNLY